MRPLRLGLKADASSGSVSVLYGCGCSAVGKALVEAAVQRFADDLPRQLQGANADLEPVLVRLLLQHSQQLQPGQPIQHGSVNAQDLQDLYAFVFGLRGLEQAEPALYRWTLRSLSVPLLSLDPLLERILIYRLIQRRDWSDILPLLKLTGPRQAERWLRVHLKPLMQDLSLLDWDADPHD